ncbi:MAG: DNA polymerase III subunit beta [Gammaproteobacteria bacterium]|nr:DNA polymerase III subunit beta [Gammaproteobacteria bacterium]NND37967.1 DNA polymerase III subunit beta [Pseudomonadales bacterium]MBT8150347.1 DNA polymerase III subunit beta [Gammaproteobacteria bacterium]NNL11208.1 DNA polymerase III subunit beta [Pseudomonadales bacterium]NNM11229.1 DNA polymerase III subunit beta [Pseudomonadales bacterium]
MKFSVQRETLLRPLSIVAGAVERRNTMPILANMLFVVKGNKLTITGTDLEVELRAQLQVNNDSGGGESITVPARKILDICKSLPESSEIKFSSEESRVVVKAGRSRFALATLSAKDFPAVQRDERSFSVTVSQSELAALIQKTAFSMAQQDVRYYLNGMLWEIDDKILRAVSTDGHRLAIAEIKLAKPTGEPLQQVIVPRKGVLELSRLLADEDQSENIELEFGGNHISAASDDLVFVSKLVDGKFPDYKRVLPKGGDKRVVADRQQLRDALQRAAILSNEKFRGVRFSLEAGTIGVQANNPEQEEASEELSVDYQGDSLEMGFNVSYLIDVLGVLNSETIIMTLSDSNSSALIQDGDSSNAAMYVVMPMRL